jgi:DNA repair exonuclease SbcCD nuclease subunit
MKAYGIISDVHCHSWSQFSRILPSGLNSRLQDILDAVEFAAKHTLNSDGDTLYIAGDLFHVRGSVSPKVLNPVKDLFEKLTGQGLKIRVLTGNHDLESRDSESLSNACEALSPIDGVTVISSMQIFHDTNMVMIPWYDKLEDVRDYIDSAIEEIVDLGDDPSNYSLMLHAPLNSVLIGIPDHGFYAKQLAKYGFKHVFCGHYHNHKEFESNVFSVGALTHQTWSDVNTKAGHLIVDDVGRVQHFENQSPKFLDYDLGWDDDTAAESVKNQFIRVRLGEADDDEIQMIRDHIVGLGAKGCVVDAIPVPKGTATARTGVTAAGHKAPTVRESISEWIKNNAAPSTAKEVDDLCADILTEALSVTM